jgi:hypothetical protein
MRTTIPGAAWIALVATCAVLFGTVARADEGMVKAVWKRQEVTFFLQTFTTFYSCEGLRGRLKTLLIAAGARKEDLRIQVTGCDPNDGPTRSPYVRITLASPVEATPENIAEIDKDHATRELAARVRNETLEPNTPFDAQWQPVPYTRGKLDLEPGECELIDELNKRVFSKLAMRVVKNELSCTPHQLTLGQPRLEMEALRRAPTPDQKLQ